MPPLSSKPRATSFKIGQGKGSSQEDVSDIAPRILACDVFCEVLKQQITINEAFQHLKPRNITPQEQQQATAQTAAIVSATFRRLTTLTRLLEQHLAKGMPKSTRLSALLLTGAAQIVLLGKPAHAVVDSMVRIAKTHPKTAHAAGLVNAVLRKVAATPLPLEETSPLVNTPQWLQARWIANYGLDYALRIAQAHQNPPNIDITIKGILEPSELEQWASQLEGFVLPTGSIRLSHRKPVSELPGYKEGAWWVQDVSSALPVKMLAPKTGENIIDLCAAPGGKTAQIAAFGAHVTAVDRSEERLKRLFQNMKRLSLKVDVLAQNVLKLPEKQYDGVLLDAPCSATGTIRRHPEAVWIKNPDIIKSLVSLQRALLDKAAQLVKPGGRLVYCTCSLEFEEGEEQIKRFLERHPEFDRDSSCVKNLGIPELENKDGDMRALPFYLPSPSFASSDMHYGMDGFFASCLHKKNLQV